MQRRGHAAQAAQQQPLVGAHDEQAELAEEQAVAQQAVNAAPQAQAAPRANNNNNNNAWRFSLPSPETFYGAGQDGSMWLSRLDNLLAVNATPDAEYVRIFGAMLRGPAETWFHTLPLGTRRDREQLRNAFTNMFVEHADAYRTTL
jgi:hypothetical protein